MSHPSLSLLLRLRWLALVLLFVSLLTVPLVKAQGVASPGPELLVKCSDGPDSEAAHRADAAVGATVIRRFENLGWYLVRLPSGLNSKEGEALYLQQPRIQNAELNRRWTPKLPPPPTVLPTSTETSPARSHVRPAATAPSDPQYRSQWNLKAIGMEAAWDITTGSTNVVVAVLDTGVNYLHPDLAENMWRNPGETGLDALGRDKATNGVDDDGDGYVDDVYGANVLQGTGDPMDLGFTRPDITTPAFHGTACAGVIAAAGNNALGMAGINWQVRVMAVKWSGGSELDGYTSDTSVTVAGFDYVVGQKRRGSNVRVISMSSAADIVSSAVTDAVRQAGEENILCVFAAGNEGVNLDTVQWHSSSEDLFNVITVGGSDRSGGILYSYGRSTVDLAAPGSEIISLGMGNQYVSDFNGTSAATPHVAGAAALLCAARPDLSLADLRAALLGSVDSLPAFRGKNVSGGRLNVGRALQSLTNTAAAPIVVWSSPSGLRADPQAPIQMHFSSPMDQASVEAALSVDPPVSGSFVWSPDGRRCAFVHVAPLSHTRHTVRLGRTAQDLSGRNLDGNFDRVPQTSSQDDYVWTFGFPLENDAFADALPLVGTTGAVAANNRTATVEVGEVAPIDSYFYDYDSSVWYRWTAPQEGWFTFDLTTGTTYDSVLTIFSGSMLSSLKEVASNLDYGARRSSRVSFLAQSGASYAIAVAGKWAPDLHDTMGAFTLRWYPTPPPGIASVTPLDGAPGQVITLNGTNFTGAIRVTLNGVPCVFQYTNQNFMDVRLSVTVPEGATTGPIGIETPLGSYVTSTAFSVFPRPALTIEMTAAGRAVLSWPNQPSGYQLESRVGLANGGEWTGRSLLPVPPVREGEVRVEDVALESSRFYRLRHP